MFLQFFFPHRAFAFGRAQLHFRNQTTEVLISEAGGDEKWKAEFTTETRRHGGIFSFRLLMVYLIFGNCESVAANVLCVSVSLG